MNRSVLFVAVFVVIVGATVVGVQMRGNTTLSVLNMSYTTAYEGVKANFYGVYVPEGVQGTQQGQHVVFTVPSTGYFTTRDGAFTDPYLTNRASHQPPMVDFGVRMKYDLFDQMRWSPNIIGEQTAIVKPDAIRPDAIPYSWWYDRITQEGETYEWYVTNNDGSYSIYTMSEFALKWFFSLSADFDSGPFQLDLDSEAGHRRYVGTEVWFELIVNDNLWYFEDQPNRAYFAIAKIQLFDNPKESGIYRENAEGKEVTQESTQYLRYSPMSGGSLMDLHTIPFGNRIGDPPAHDEKAYYYSFQGSALNPQLFRPTLYTYFDLLDFGTHSWFELPWTAKAIGDVVTVGCVVSVFVFGEWVVQDIGSLPDWSIYGRIPQYVEEFDPLTEWWLNFISNPWNVLMAMGYGLIAIVVITFLVLWLVFGVNPVKKLKLRGEGQRKGTGRRKTR